MSSLIKHYFFLSLSHRRWVKNNGAFLRPQNCSSQGWGRQDISILQLESRVLNETIVTFMKNIKVSVACVFVLLPRNHQNPTAKTVPVQRFQGRDKKVIMINLKIIIEWVSSDSWINAVLTNAKLYPIDRDFEKTTNIVKRLYLREKKYIFPNYCWCAIQFLIAKPHLPSTRVTWSVQFLR